MFSDLNDQALKQSSKDTICPVLSSSNQNSRSLYLTAYHMLKAFGELSVFNTDIVNFPVIISVELLGCHRN